MVLLLVRFVKYCFYSSPLSVFQDLTSLVIILTLCSDVISSFSLLIFPSLVDFFFILTGFLTAYPILAGQRTGSWFSFVWRRMTRLYPAYIASMIFFCLILHKNASLPILPWSQHIPPGVRDLIISTGADPGEGLPNKYVHTQRIYLRVLFILAINSFNHQSSFSYLSFFSLPVAIWHPSIFFSLTTLFPLVVAWDGPGL